MYFDNTEAMVYVRSIKDAVKRRYAATYLEWLRSGRQGSGPSRGYLSPSQAKAVTANLEALK